MTVISLPRPLSDHAKAECRELLEAPVPRCSVNPGVARKLLAEGLAEIVQLPSPFKTHKGKQIDFLQATDATRRALARRPNERIPVNEH